MKIYVVGSSKNRFLPLNNIREKFIVDQPHEGDNIDQYNHLYCELTGLYYLWKHVDDDIVGLEHYRRYFFNNNWKLLEENEIKTLLNDADILCAHAAYSKYRPVITWINNNGKRYDFDKFLIFAKIYIGQNYIDNCLNILNGDYHCLGNMFICKKELINEYCSFIFDLLDKYYKAELAYNRIPPNRIFGYFAEFLFAAWLKMENKKIKWINWKKV